MAVVSVGGQYEISLATSTSRQVHTSLGELGHRLEHKVLGAEFVELGVQIVKGLLLDGSQLILGEVIIIDQARVQRECLWGGDQLTN